jgi:hypothetical protein
VNSHKGEKSRRRKGRKGRREESLQIGGKDQRENELKFCQILLNGQILFFLSSSRSSSVLSQNLYSAFNGFAREGQLLVSVGQNHREWGVENAAFQLSVIYPGM